MNLFKNAGAKLKTAAVVLFFLEAVVSVISGLYIILQEGVLTVGSMSGVASIIFGLILSYAANLVLYGFGVIVEAHEK